MRTFVAVLSCLLGAAAAAQDEAKKGWVNSSELSLVATGGNTPATCAPTTP